MLRRPAALVLVAALAASGLAACGNASDDATGDTSGGGDKLAVVASFYPLQHAIEQVGGDRVEVTNLTKPGAEPHDVELSPQDVAKVSEADLAVYEKGLQPAVDEAIGSQAPEKAFDVSGPADLSLTFAPAVGGEDEHAHEGEAEHAEHDHSGEAGQVDPHFWLDPVRYEKVSSAIAQKLAEVDPENKAVYERNAQAFAQKLAQLDGEFTAGLRQCASKNLVTSHAAFGYLADRYHLQQVAISGLEPDAEPEPARLAAISDYAKKHDVRTIYSETLVDPAVAQTVATSAGAKTAVLDPIEGLTDSSAARDYVGIMRANLATLRQGQGCS